MASKRHIDEDEDDGSEVEDTPMTGSGSHERGVQTRTIDLSSADRKAMRYKMKLRRTKMDSLAQALLVADTFPTDINGLVGSYADSLKFTMESEIKLETYVDSIFRVGKSTWISSRDRGYNITACREGKLERQFRVPTCMLTSTPNHLLAWNQHHGRALQLYDLDGTFVRDVSLTGIHEYQDMFATPTHLFMTERNSIRMFDLIDYSYVHKYDVGLSIVYFAVSENFVFCTCDTADDDAEWKVMKFQRNPWKLVDVLLVNYKVRFDNVRQLDVIDELLFILTSREVHVYSMYGEWMGHLLAPKGTVFNHMCSAGQGRLAVAVGNWKLKRVQIWSYA